jgi:hypothetical protein
LRGPKDFQVKEDKIIANDSSYTIYQITPILLTPTITWKGAEEGR